MNIQRFTAPTAREALAKARMMFGDGTLILSNRPTAHGIEVVATAEDTVPDHMSDEPHEPALEPAVRPAPKSTQPVATANSRIEDDMDQLSMSTLSFQDYVRERMLLRRQEGLQGASRAAGRSATRPAQASAQPNAQSATTPQMANQTEKTSTAAASSKPATQMRSSGSKSSDLPSTFKQEMNAMRALIEERFDALSWIGQARQSPVVSDLMLKFIRAGYSAQLTRAILEKLPHDAIAADSQQWITDVLERNLKTDANTQPVFEAGGTFALVGATGVGKTTTALKLAHLCVQNYGTNSVGLITLDTHRAGAHEQLRLQGRMLGVVAHLAHDRAALQDLLSLLGNKKMILIDTEGVAPHDPRCREMLDVLDIPHVNRLLVLNAGSHGETLDDVASTFKSGNLQQTILTKLDEAVKLGPALDTVIRHQLLLRGVTTGQKIPEDWEQADAAKLVRASFRAQGKASFEPKTAELGLYFSPYPAYSTARAGDMHNDSALLSASSPYESSSFTGSY